MNIYKIQSMHYAPKDSEEGIKTYLIAENDESVYKWFISNPEGIHISWEEKKILKYDAENDIFIDEDGDDSEEYFTDDEGNPENYKQKILRNKGDIGEEFDSGDAYYGITQYGWELIKENISDEQLEFLTETKIAIKA